MSPIKQTFIAADGELREKRTEEKMYRIGRGKKDFLFVNGFLPECSSVVKELGIFFSEKK